jgi:hypothetical protein
MIHDAWASTRRKLVSMGYAPSLWFRQITHNVKLANLQTCHHFRRIALKATPDTCRRELFRLNCVEKAATRDMALLAFGM